MADSQRLAVKHLVNHHAVTPLWEDKSKQWLADWFSNNGFARAYGSNPANWSGLVNPYTGARSYAQAHYAGQRVTAATPDATAAERAAGYRLVPLVKDILGQITWGAGNWAINRACINIEHCGDYRNYTLRDGDCKVVADMWRPQDRAMGGDTKIWGHQQVTLSATACPARIMEQLNTIIKYVNDGSAAPSPSPSPTPGSKSNEEIAKEVMAGKWGNNPERRTKLIAAGYDYAAIQAIVNGEVGQAPSTPRKSNTVIAAEVMAGAWGNNPERQQRLKAAGYDYNAIQTIVNGQVGSTPATPPKASIESIADQVIAGAWGNGDDRKAKLTAAGYDYGQVQAAVNAKLGQGVAGKKSNDQVANEVLAGKWGNNPERRDRLAAAGYDYQHIQDLVNRKLGL